ncbi:hypothetical protein KIN20_027897 [Parelaphostrongylus tenuis]|uniref:Uncharacterized protein n=1 Tax=Parelaphostrongylus tenuis TaxID=148309 RepID=A0AAD5WE85_PARTN|nr:hypothetical protein KIN20_027897 [Parelaphostrongylus tenuis]
MIKHTFTVNSHDEVKYQIKLDFMTSPQVQRRIIRDVKVTRVVMHLRVQKLLLLWVSDDAATFIAHSPYEMVRKCDRIDQYLTLSIAAQFPNPAQVEHSVELLCGEYILVGWVSR